MPSEWFSLGFFFLRSIHRIGSPGPFFTERYHRRTIFRVNERCSLADHPLVRSRFVFLPFRFNSFDDAGGGGGGDGGGPPASGEFVCLFALVACLETDFDMSSYKLSLAYARRATPFRNRSPNGWVT